jgi:cellulose synthase/poly-beta-1,6-N-acetylglucosamine synthase-like glycosyltransferase
MNSPREDYEVIVVDGGSTDSTVEVARQAGARVIVARGRNIPASRNIGVANAAAPVIAFLDADCLVHPEWLNRGLKHFEGGGDKLVGSPAGLPEDATWVQRLWADHWQAKTRSLANRPNAEVYRLLSTRNLFTTRRAIESVGGFDEGLSTGEDYYFCYQAHARGIPLKCDGEITVAHIGEPATLGEFFHEQVWHASNAASMRLLKEGAWGGLNALIFGIYMGICLLAFAAGLMLGLLGRGRTVAVVGLVLLLGGPFGLALRVALRTRRWSRVPGYAIIYFIYGFARLATLWRGFWITQKRPKNPPREP